MRYVLMHKGRGQVSSRAKEILSNEMKSGLDKVSTYLEFATKCEFRRVELKSLLTELKERGKTVAGYAATSKSTTVLNYCGLNTNFISYICDSTPEKQGRLTPGTQIPIISPSQMRSNPPDYLILFAWNHEEEILQNERELTESGVQWIRFVPNIEILD
jgi:methylation protein EvaC